MRAINDRSWAYKYVARITPFAQISTDLDMRTGLTMYVVVGLDIKHRNLHPRIWVPCTWSHDWVIGIKALAAAVERTARPERNRVAGCRQRDTSVNVAQV